ncbi:hypothetical protein PVAP13_3NG081000 [Panicum virgatum]|uniref:Uncharacterized protein n=1 Tax=Panicum virgatum TaxID=38727 RepID=A0A8T0U5S9_PANVG|nr:hypothetical protein PVAP13_3NG081000 [Panicum virgatum]
MRRRRRRRCFSWRRCTRPSSNSSSPSSCFSLSSPNSSRYPWRVPAPSPPAAVASPSPIPPLSSSRWGSPRSRAPVAPFTIASSRLEAVSNVTMHVELCSGAVGLGRHPCCRPSRPRTSRPRSPPRAGPATRSRVHQRRRSA